MARKLTKDFSWKNATFMAKIAHAAYMGPDEFNKTFYKQWKDGIDFFSKGGTECYVLHCDKNYIVAFRGTEPTSWEDIKADIQFTKQEKTYEVNAAGKAVGKMHKGFRAALEDVWKDLHSHYLYHGKGKQLLITGHSLGAALATLYADRISDPNSACYTFGSPRVGDRKLINKMNFTCYRFRNNNDIVTRVPPEWIGYTHKSDELFYFDVDGIPRRGFNRWFMFMQWIKGTYRGLMRDKTWDAFADHSMGDYYNLCKQQLAEENASN